MVIQGKKIAIVGGGPGGLTLARLLQRNGATVKVYERDVDQHVRVQGATLDLHDDSGLKALQEAGLMDAFKANFRPGADRIRIVDKNAIVLLDEHTDAQEQTFGDAAFRPEIDRGPLRTILLESLQPDTVIWNSQFESMESVGDSWRLHFKNGTSADADVVIAADGANSKIRPFITPIKPFYVGLTVVEGAIYHPEIVAPRLHQLVNGGKIFAFGDEKSIIISAKGDGSLVFYTGCKTDKFWAQNSGIDFTSKVQVQAWFEQTFSGWDPIYRELINEADIPFVPRPQYCMPLDQTWEALPNLTLLGDAAHLMPPYAGEGVNMAMLDALELSRCLISDKFLDGRAAIDAYEQQMRKRASEMAQMTLVQTDSLHAPNAIAHMLAVVQ